MRSQLWPALGALGVAAIAAAVAIPDLPHGVVVGLGFAGSALLSIAVVSPVSGSHDPRRRRVVRVGAVMLAIQLTGLARALRVGVVHPDEIASRQAVGDDDAVLTNPRLSSRQLTQPRGRILTSDGTIVARSRESGGMMRRQYDEPSMYSLVGYVSPLKFGLGGLEKTLDGQLTGIDSMTIGAAFRKSLLGTSEATGTVHLSIELPVQQLAASLLDGLIGSAVLIEAQSGRVLAMASSPTIDPNRLVAVDAQTAADAQEYWDEVLNDKGRPLLLRATTGLYPPGSTFKVVTAAAAIQRGLATPTSVYSDTGELVVDGRRLVERNRPDASRTEWTLSEGLAYSLNLVYAQVGLQIGGDDLRESTRAFGIGETIPGDLPTSSGQIMSSPNFLTESSALADTAFGQGELLVTPLHMALVAASIARDGTVPIPTLVDRVTAGDDEIERRSPRVWRRAMSPETAAALDQMMIDSATYGYARTAAVDGLRVGAKTGTAESGRDQPHSWFIAYGSNGKTSVAVAVCIEFGGEGGGLALRIGRDLLASALTS